MTPGNVAALLTPPGAGAIAVIRIAGSDALVVTAQLFQPSGSNVKTLEPNHLHYGRFRINGEVVDDVVVSHAVIDGVPIVDVSTHGGVRIVERVLQAYEEKGIRFDDASAVPSWAMENLIEQEISEALAQAKTGRAVRFLSMQRKRLVSEICRVADLVRDNPAAAKHALRNLLVGFKAARRLIEGVSVALVGPPNSGKSTLFNALIGRGAAVVSPQAGTTRDWVEADIELDGLSVRLIDCAGTHEHADELERQAIEAGHGKVMDADLRILVLDGSDHTPHQARDLIRGIDSPMIVAINKSDLESLALTTESISEQIDDTQVISLSARTNTGLPSLRSCVNEMMDLVVLSEIRPTLFTNRQSEIVTKVLSDVVGRAGDPGRMMVTEMICG